MRPVTEGLVSVVVAARNEEEFIREALESVLAQDHEPAEVIVVDDGSTDATAQVAAGFGVRVLQTDGEGPGAARNAGLAVASGEFWVAFDADDVMPPGRLARQVAYLNEHPEAGAVLGLTEAFTTPGQPRPAHFSPAWANGPFPWHPATMMARRATLATVGLYDPSRRLGEDIDWQSRAREAGIVAGHLDSVCLYYRVHSANSTNDLEANRSATLAVLREGLHRRRDRSHDDAG